MLEELINKNLILKNNYFYKYLDLITNYKCDLNSKIKQKHHIIPRSYYRHENLKCDDSKNNLIYLSYADHILAHYYLALCSTSWFQYCAIMAFDYLIKRLPYERNVNLLELSESDLLNLLPKLNELKEKAISEESERRRGGKWVTNGLTQKYVRGEILNQFLVENPTYKIGKLAPSKETLEKRLNTFYERHVKSKWMTNGTEDKIIPEPLIPQYLNLGWRLGRSHANSGGWKATEEMKRRNSEWHKGKEPWNKGKKGLQGKNRTSFVKGNVPKNKGRKYVNNGIIEINILKEQIDEYLNNGFKLGRLPGSYHYHNKE